MHLQVEFLPDFLDQPSLAGGTAVVIDVLRASTTIVAALASGAKAVVPCATIEEAESLAQTDYRGALLGGERQGLPIAGFDLGNSPGDYTAERIAGATIVFTTTNGTRALRFCESSPTVLLAAFTNLSTVVRELTNHPQVTIVCAGTDRTITREDVLLAGALVTRLSHPPADRLELNDQAHLAAAAWRECERSLSNGGNLADQLELSLGGRNVLRIGRGEDIRSAAQIDRHAVVPRFRPETGQIVVESAQPTHRDDGLP